MHILLIAHFCEAAAILQFILLSRRKTAHALNNAPKINENIKNRNSLPIFEDGIFMHNKYKIERATPQFDRRGSTTTIETSFNISPENIQPKLDSVDLKSVNTNLNIKSSSGMENAGADHLYSTALTSNILPKLPNTPSVNLGSTDAGEPNHGYVSDFHNAAVGGRKPSMPVSRALVSTEDKTGGADYTDSAPYSGSLNKNKYGGSGKTEIISLETNQDNLRNDKKFRRKTEDKKTSNDRNNKNNQIDGDHKSDHINQSSSQKTNQADWPGSIMSSGEGPIQRSTLAKVHCLDTSKDGSGKKTTISENGSASEKNGREEVGVMSMEAFYKVPKSMMMLMLGIIGFLIILFLLMIIIFGALIASTNSKVKTLENKNEEQRVKIVDLESRIQNSSNDELLIKVQSLTRRIESLEGNNLTNRTLALESENLPFRMQALESESIPVRMRALESKNLHVRMLSLESENLPARMQALESENLPVRMQALESENLPVRMQALESENLPVRVQALESEINSLKGSFQNMNETVSNSVLQINSLNESIQAWNNTVEALTEDMQNIETRVDDKEIKIEQLNSTINNHTTELSSLDSEIETAKRNIKGMKLDIIDINSEMNLMETDIQRIKDHLNMR